MVDIVIGEGISKLIDADLIERQAWEELNASIEEYKQMKATRDYVMLQFDEGLNDLEAEADKLYDKIEEGAPYV